MSIRKLGRTWAMTLLAIFGSNSQEAFAGFVIGSTFQVSGTNTPNTFTENVTLSPGTTLIDGGKLSLTQSIIDIGNSEWFNLHFEATSGLLSNNPSAFWQIDVENLNLASPEQNSERLAYWTVNGDPVEPIQPFYQFTPVLPNPIDALHRNAYVIHGDFSIISIDFAKANSTPYSTIGFGGMNTGTVTGFDVAVQVTSLVPEPSSAILVASAAMLGLGITRLRRRRMS